MTSQRGETHRPVLLLEQIGHKAPDLGSEQQTGLRQEKDLYFVYSRSLHFIDCTTSKRWLKSLIVCNLTLILICTDFHMGPAWLTQPVTPSSFWPLPISSSLLFWASAIDFRQCSDLFHCNCPSFTPLRIKKSSAFLSPVWSAGWTVTLSEN